MKRSNTTPKSHGSIPRVSVFPAAPRSSADCLACGDCSDEILDADIIAASGAETAAFCAGGAEDLMTDVPDVAFSGVVGTGAATGAWKGASVSAACCALYKKMTFPFGERNAGFSS